MSQLGSPCEALQQYCCDIANEKPPVGIRVVKLPGFAAMKPCGFVRSIFSAELNELVDSIEQLTLLQATFRQLHGGTHRSVEELVGLFGGGQSYPPWDFGGVAPAALDAIEASHALGPAEFR